MFTERDIIQIRQRGQTPETALRQINHFKAGFPYADLDRPAVPGDGILVLPPEEVVKLAGYFDNASKQLRMVKFVPASGAATRMFKDLFAFQDASVVSGRSEHDLLEQLQYQSVKEFFGRRKDFAFFPDLVKEAAVNGVNAYGERYGDILRVLLDDSGLGYGRLPKGLLKFHSYVNASRTGMEEHLAEAALYAKNGSNEAEVHFTVSPEHLEGFKKTADEVLPAFMQRYGVAITVTFSQQSPATDTIAVDMENNPFREADGSLVFRPGGHGALIGNLNDIGADIIFVKNIDNIVPDRLKEPTVLYKKALAALLLGLQSQIFAFLNELEQSPQSASLPAGIGIFAEKELGIKFSEEFYSAPVEQQKKALYSMLHRPVRVCGMVKNEGEPGGGPFWVRQRDGSVTLQIVESSQVNLMDQGQKEILRSATHFNPVDLVCGIRDHKGEFFSLQEYVDPETGFISVKSKDGKALKAQELPGLWNGAMAGWITLFVEVPVITFNPVKVVNDLLRPQHQPA